MCWIRAHATVSGLSFQRFYTCFDPNECCMKNRSSPLRFEPTTSKLRTFYLSIKPCPWFWQTLNVIINFIKNKHQTLKIIFSLLLHYKDQKAMAESEFWTNVENKSFPIQENVKNFSTIWSKSLKDQMFVAQTRFQTNQIWGKLSSKVISWKYDEVWCRNIALKTKNGTVFVVPNYFHLEHLLLTKKVLYLDRI